MKPFFTFSDEQKYTLFSALSSIKTNPYKNHEKFLTDVENIIDSCQDIELIASVCEEIKFERDNRISEAHVLRNCPIDLDIPRLNNDDPLNDKYLKKSTFLGEAFLALISRLLDNPLLAYETRHNGDFFTDVIANNKYSGKLTGFSDGELVFHNDRTAHPVRADFIYLLGLNCPTDDLIYTSYISGNNLLQHISKEHSEVLRKPYFLTKYDVYSKDNNDSLDASAPHAIFDDSNCIRYLDTLTGTSGNAPEIAKDALIAFKNAVSLVTKTRHRILTGDLLMFSNQQGLHNREKIDVQSEDASKSRWLLKTYTFSSAETAKVYQNKWVNGIYGRVGD
jgi:L-asparagine oxygenase